MIERFVEGDALDATESMLLVPLPIQDNKVYQGFARKVFDRYPAANDLFYANNGLKAGEFMMVGGMGGKPDWQPNYSLLLAGMHRRQNRGWKDAPKYLEDILGRVTSIYAPDTLATAGIPGTGYSGLPGDADPQAIEQVLADTSLHVFVYRRNDTNDRAEVLRADPPKELTTAAQEPASEVVPESVAFVTV